MTSLLNAAFGRYRRVAATTKFSTGQPAMLARPADFGQKRTVSDLIDGEPLKRIALAFFVCTSATAQVSPFPEAASSIIEYGSVAEALRALRVKPNVEISVQRDWTIVEEPAIQALWSFAPKGHAAYPAVVKRKVVERGGIVSIETDVVCEASKTACDALVREFVQMNQNVRP